MPLYSKHRFVHNFMRTIGVKISIHVTNFTLIVIHVPFAEKSYVYIIFDIVNVTFDNLYYLMTLLWMAFCALHL